MVNFESFSAAQTPSCLLCAFSCSFLGGGIPSSLDAMEEVVQACHVGQFHTKVLDAQWLVCIEREDAETT